MARNAMSVKMEFGPDSIQTLIDAVKGISGSTSMRIMAEAMKDACKPIVDDAKARIPIRTGALRKSMGVVVRTYPEAKKIVAIIGPQNLNLIAARTPKGKMSARKFGNGDDPKKRINPAKYAHLVEFGHRSVHGGGALPNYGEKVKGVWNSVNKGRTIRHGTVSATSFVAPHPFLRPAFDAGKDKVLETMEFAFHKAVMRAVKRMTAKTNRKLKQWQVAA